jgi:uncharacterized protein involved in oxidation of intracellular sulfur
MNKPVDLARDSNKMPCTDNHELSQMFRGMIARNTQARVCGACIVRCGLHKNEPYCKDTEKSTIAAFAKGQQTAIRFCHFKSNTCTDYSLP